MSSVAVRSVATASTTGSPNPNNTFITITKPSGLAVGDLMVACISASDSTNGIAFQTPAGWTLVENPGGTGAQNSQIAVLWKIADANDVAATDFTFNWSDGNKHYGFGGIAALTGADDTNPVVAHHSNGSSTSTTISDSTGITPGTPPLLLMFVGHYDNGGARTISGYQTTNNNPSWTELWDSVNGGGIIGCAAASGPYAASTTTGAYQATASGSLISGMIALLAIQPQIVKPSVIAMALSVFNPTIAKTILPTFVSMALSVLAPVISIAAPRFRNLTKHSASWVNQNKS